MMPPTTYINLMDIMTIMVGFYNSTKGWLEIKLTLELSVIVYWKDYFLRNKFSAVLSETIATILSSTTHMADKVGSNVTGCVAPSANKAMTAIDSIAIIKWARANSARTSLIFFLAIF